MAFHFEIKLSRMAMLTYALSLWKKGDIPHKLMQFYYPYGRRGKMVFLENLIDEVINKIDRTSLPDALYYKVVQVVNDIAYKTHDWFFFLKRKKIFRDQTRKQLYDIYLKDVFWTHYGTIDGFKIMKYSWLNIQNVDLTKIYVMACCFCHEELIQQLWDKIKFSISYKQLCSRTGFHLVVYWNKLRENKLEDLVRDCINPNSAYPNKVYNVDQSVEVNMLRLAITKGFVSAVKYFWNKLNQQERDENIQNFIISTLDGYFDKSSYESYRKDQYAEIFLFLLNFANQVAKENVFTDKETERDSPSASLSLKYLTNVLDISIKSPWNEFFNPIFDEIQSFLTEDAYLFLIRNLMDLVSFENRHIQSLLKQIWMKIPNEFKIYLVSGGRLISLFEKWDVIDIQFILYDEVYLVGYTYPIRDEIIHSLYSSVISLIRDNKSVKLNQFIDEVLIPAHESVELQDVMQSFYRIIMKGEINSAKGFLNDLEEYDIKAIKKAMDPVFMCYYFVMKKKFDWADKFLKWKYGSEEEVKRFKIIFKGRRDFTDNHISYLWQVSKKEVQAAKNNCDDFLLWLLGTKKDVVLYKLTEIAPHIYESTEPLFIDIENHFDVLDDFLHWTLLNDEAVKIFKVEVFREKQLKFFIPEAVKLGRFEEVTKICKWAFDSQAEMYKFMKEVLLSDCGVMAIKLFISKYASPNIFDPWPKEKLKAKFSDFIEFLTKPLGVLELLNEVGIKGWWDQSGPLFENIDSDAPSTEDDMSEWSDSEHDVRPVYCKRDHLQEFLNLILEKVKKPGKVKNPVNVS